MAPQRKIIRAKTFGIVLGIAILVRFLASAWEVAHPLNTEQPAWEWLQQIGSAERTLPWIGLIHTLLGCSTAVLYAQISKNLFHRESQAVWTGGLIALLPHLVYQEHLLLPTTLSTFLLACSLIIASTPGITPMGRFKKALPGVVLILSFLLWWKTPKSWTQSWETLTFWLYGEGTVWDPYFLGAKICLLIGGLGLLFFWQNKAKRPVGGWIILQGVFVLLGMGYETLLPVGILLGVAAVRELRQTAKAFP